jgi:hypothetical protein
MSFWHAFWAPKGTPRDIIAKLNQAVVSTLADPLVRKRLIDIAQEIFPREQQTAGGARRLSEGRDREVVANHQGSGHPE